MFIFQICLSLFFKVLKSQEVGTWVQDDEGFHVLYLKNIESLMFKLIGFYFRPSEDEMGGLELRVSDSGFGEANKELLVGRKRSWKL